LWYASHAGWYDITELLLESGADPNLPLHNPPLIATVEGRTSDITTISVLVSSPNINLDYQDNLGRTALLWAVSKGRSDVVQVLLEAGANPNIGNHEDRTPLMMSVVISNVVMTKLLLDYGADVNDQDFAGRTALHYSVNTISPTVILDRDNVDLDIQDNLGRTPLIDAVDHNDVRAVSLLVEAGADPLVADNRGNTALYYAGRNDTLHEVISDAVEDYTERYNAARDSLSSKLAVAKMSVSTFGQRQIPEFIVRQSEYNSLCSVLSKNTKPNIQALAKSLNITIFNKSKTMLCQEITQKLKL
jgi:ankyrin repeat protein